MKRYLEIFLGCIIAGVGALISLACVTMVKSLFFGNVGAFRFRGFEVSVNNGLIFFTFALGFSIGLIFIGAAIALEDRNDNA